MSEITIKALSTFVAFTGEMRVFNAGDVGPLPANIAQSYIETGQAEAVTDEAPPAKAPAAAKPQLDHDKDGKAGGSAAGDDSTAALGAARKRYRAAVGRNAGPRWDVATIEAKLAAHLAANPPADTDEADAPPSE